MTYYIKCRCHYYHNVEFYELSNFSVLFGEFQKPLFHLSVLEQFALFNSELYDNELRTILNRFLFPVSTWNKKCSYLSGGEKMKLSLCCLMVSAQAPDVFIVDEPTNNIDILSMEILTETLKDYQGTLLVVSHDNYFVQQIKADKQIELF